MRSGGRRSRGDLFCPETFGRALADHGRSRQLRNDGRSEDQWASYLSHDESRAIHPNEQRARRFKVFGSLEGCRSHGARNPGTGTTEAHDGRGSSTNKLGSYRSSAGKLAGLAAGFCPGGGGGRGEGGGG